MKLLPALLSAALLLTGALAQAESIEDMVIAQAAGGPQAPLRAKVDDNGDLLGLLVYAPDPHIAPDFYPVSLFRNGADIGVSDDKGSVHHGVFYIKAPGFDSHNGGPVTIRWTRNVLLRTHSQMGLWAGRDGSGQWRLFNGPVIVRALVVTPGLLGIENVSAQ